MRYQLALGYVLLSATLNSFGGLFVRSVESASIYQVIFYRSLGLTVAVTLALVIVNKRAMIKEFLSIGPWGIAGGLLYCDATIFFVLSLSHTTIANTLFVLSAVPFFTAFLGWIFIREPVSLATWCAMLVAASGIAIMLGDGWLTGQVFGNVLAVASAFCFSGFIVVLRAKRATDMMPTICIGSAIAALGGASMARFDFAVVPADLILCVVWGAVFSCLALILLITGSRYLRGADLTVLVLLEYILGPIWVWLAIGEIPTTLTLVGGSLVLLAVVGRALIGFRPSPSPADV